MGAFVVNAFGKVNSPARGSMAVGTGKVLVVAVVCSTTPEVSHLHNIVFQVHR